MTFGNLERLDDGRAQLRFTRVLRHPPEKVWRAITEPQHLAAWFPSTVEGVRVAGGPLRFTFAGAQPMTIDGELVIFDPPRLMEFRWGPDLLRFELRPALEGTELTLFDTFDEMGKAARDGAGWHVSLDALAAHLSGDPNSHEAMRKWAHVHAQYVESFGPEAATIGPPERT